MSNSPEIDHSHLNSPEWQEYAKQNRAWVENPERNKIRRTAKKIIKARIGEIVEPLGFQPVERGTGWEIKKGLKVRGIYVQASRGGDRCYFNLAKRYRYKILRRNEEVIRLGRFYESGYDRVGEPGSLYYYDIGQFPKYVDRAMDIIAKRAVPWLLS